MSKFSNTGMFSEQKNLNRKYLVFRTSHSINVNIVEMNKIYDVPWQIPVV